MNSGPATGFCAPGPDPYSAAGAAYPDLLLGDTCALGHAGDAGNIGGTGSYPTAAYYFSPTPRPETPEAVHAGTEWLHCVSAAGLAAAPLTAPA